MIKFGFSIIDQLKCVYLLFVLRTIMTLPIAIVNSIEFNEFCDPFGKHIIGLMRLRHGTGTILFEQFHGPLNTK